MSGTLTPRDALLVINHLNYGDPSLTQPGDDSVPGVFDTDVDGDGQITAADADAVITALNQSMTSPAADAAWASEDGAEGESLPLMAPPPSPIPPGDAALPFITKAEVETLLSRAAGATSTQDAIIAIVDRGGNILGVRLEQGVLNNIPDTLTRVFAIDGAVAKARTAAFFASDQAPLTSRTIRSLSQTTITEREVESNPTVPNPLDPAQNPFVDANAISRTFGPGLVAPIGVGGHFPQDIAHTPPVDLFNIELQSRDGLTHPGADGIKGTADDIALSNRFNVPTADLPQGDIPTPESYGVQSGLVPQAQGRGIAT
ncbi:MAG TPA: dockerin type I domain-containing protein, partial [Thermomicrobiales bacterium]|nr:dockerin type I domain-containing protein [Thermomicrobiales bacterium]